MIVKTFPRPYGVAAYVIGLTEEIKRLRLPEPKLIPFCINPKLAYVSGLSARRIGGFRTIEEVAAWCKQHRYWFPH